MKNSAYSKMFLVLPSIYDKVLKCIDEKDKKVLETLNTEKDQRSTRPSEKYFENVANNELQNNPPEVIQNQTQQTIFIDPDPISSDNSDVPEQTFGDEEMNNNDYNDENQTREETNNPLKNDCAQPDIQDQLIPKIIPGFKRKNSTTTKTKVVIPQIIKKNSLLQKTQTSADDKTNKIQNSKPNRILRLKNVPRNFMCNFCSKNFKSSYHLKRHMSVHKDLIAKSNPKQFENSIESQQQQNIQPVVPQPGTSTNQFANWNEDSIFPVHRSNKRTATEAELNNEQPHKMRSKDYDEWK